MKDETQIKDEIMKVVKEAVRENTTLAAVDWEPAMLYDEDVDHIAEMVADNLYHAGYRKQSEVAENIIEMLKAAKPVVKVHFEAYDEPIENIAAEYGVEVYE